MLGMMQILLRLRRRIRWVLFGQVKGFISELISCRVRVAPDDAELI
jgi:hypothetical protein